MKGLKIGVFLIALTSAFAVSAQQESTFKTDPSTGVMCRLKPAGRGEKGIDSDFAKVVMVVAEKTSSGKDTILFDSHKMGGDSTGIIPLPMKKTFNGCLAQGLLMMSPGDTAEFLIRADSFFVKEQHMPPGNLPPGITENTVFVFRIKLNCIVTQKDLMDEMMKKRMAMIEEIKARKKQEPADISAYLKKNKYSEKPDADSIFYLKAFNSHGIGKQVKENDSVEIKYTGMFLDGKIFDQSDKGTGRGTFKILFSQNAPLIKGWISIIGKMHQGEKTRVLIPSSMAYGARGYSYIKPYTPLVFDMEIVSINSIN